MTAKNELNAIEVNANSGVEPLLAETEPSSPIAGAQWKEDVTQDIVDFIADQKYSGESELYSGVLAIIEKHAALAPTQPQLPVFGPIDEEKQAQFRELMQESEPTPVSPYCPQCGTEFACECESEPQLSAQEAFRNWGQQWRPLAPTEGLSTQEAARRCPHERLNEDGICRSCGADCRGIHP